MNFTSFGNVLQGIARERRSNIPDNRLNEFRISGGAELNPADGGFAVTETYSGTLLSRIYSQSVFAQRCLRIPVSSGQSRLRLPGIDETSRADSRFGGIKAAWIGEGQNISATIPKFKALRQGLDKCAVAVYVSNELLEDATALQAVIETLAAGELAFTLDGAIMRGNGAGLPLGALRSDALITISKESGQEDDTIVWENIIKMAARLDARHFQTAAWYINADVLPQMLVMGKAAVGSTMPVWQSSMSGAGIHLLGLPVIINEHSSTLGQLGDIVLADFGQYVLCEMPLRQQISVDVDFMSDQTVFKFVLRVRGNPLWSSTVLPLHGSETVSPFIALEARSSTTTTAGA